MNAAALKRDFSTLLELRRTALNATLDARERQEGTSTELNLDPESNLDVQVAGELFTVLDDAVVEMRKILIDRLGFRPETLYDLS